MINQNMGNQKEFIKKKRDEIISELGEYLKEINHDMTISQILAQVLNDHEEEAFGDMVTILSENDDVPDMDSAQEFAMKLFNYFPRKSLGGKSLAEKMPFDELKKIEEAFQKYKDGTATSGYSYTLPE